MELTKNIINELFPAHPETHYMINAVEKTEKFYRIELDRASLRLKSGKAVGTDRVPPDIIKILTKVCPDEVLRVMNNHFEIGEFPCEWKTARLLLLKKSGKPDFDTSGNRPICLLNSIGKLMEQLLNARLTQELDKLCGI